VEHIIGTIIRTTSYELNTTDTNGMTALMCAIMHGHITMARLLLECNPKPLLDLMTKDCDTVLILASKFRRDMIVRMLLECQPNLDTQNNTGYTTLMLASMKGYHLIVRMLLECDPPPSLDIQNKNGMTALMLASISGHEIVVRLFLNCFPQPSISI